jgi:hypothetical protein
MQLREATFVAWHTKRNEVHGKGRDLNTVRLTFVDTLDNLNCIVASKRFQLRRSKSSPLLIRYQISRYPVGRILSDRNLAWHTRMRNAG